VPDLRMLMITQKVDQDDDVLGFTHTWVNKLAERVAQLHVLALSVGRHELRENVMLYSMGKERGAGRVRRFVNFTHSVAPLVWQRQVDVVFVHMAPLYAILAAPWTKLARVPMVLWFTHKSVNWKLKLAHWLVDRVVTASSESFRLSSDKVVVTGHGIDTEVFKPVEGPRSEQPFTVLSVGRISPIKDYETLIEAADILVNQRGQRDLRFVVVGDVDTLEQIAYRERLWAEVQRRGLGDCFRFLGAVPHRQVVDHYQLADLFVNLCPTGGLDKAVLEAMACGVIPLTSNRAFASVLGAWGHELLFPEGDAKTLVERLIVLKQRENGSGQCLGKNLRAMVVSEHSIESLVDKLVALFGQLLTRRRVGHGD
jgi:glycosyltransferase involved in cell wall biosynthesis